jgi:superoxide reductase
MDRRRFATRTLFGALLAAAATVGRAQPAAPPGAAPGQAPTLPKQNIFFSEDDPGHWVDWVSLHVPQTTVEAGVLTIRTPHPQSDEHYIVSHSVVLAGGAFLSRETFTANQPPVSQHPLPAGYAGAVTVVSTCNRHDTWVKTLVV